MPGNADTVNALLAHAAWVADAGIRLIDRRMRDLWCPWRSIHEQASITAGGLTACGVRPGDRVAMVFPTGMEFLRVFFGALLVGAVPVPLCPPLRLGTPDAYALSTAEMMKNASARMVMIDGRFGWRFGDVTARYRPPLGVRTLDDLPESPAPEVSPCPADLALVQYSSGTTRSPKPVALSHRAIVAQARILNGFWPDTETVRHSGVSWLPLNHDMGLIGCLLPALERTSTLTLMDPEIFIATPASWLRTISRYRATISPATNSALDLSVSRIRDDEMEGIDLSSWRVAPIGAETASAATLEAFRKRFSRWGLRSSTLTPVYGLSEAALAVTFSDLHRPFRSATFDPETLWSHGEAAPRPEGLNLVSVGRPVPGFALRIRDDRGGELPERRIGHIWVRGVSMMDGYLDQPETTAAVMADAWLDTGDLGFVDAGELFITGRAKELVVVRGRKYDPGVLETAVNGVPGAREDRAVAASRVAHDGRGEEFILLVERRPGFSEAALRHLPDRCAAAMLTAAGIAPDRVVVLAPGALPRTSSGKLRRGEALRRYELDSLTALERNAVEREVQPTFKIH